MSERPHGYARYKMDGCRCPDCRRSVSLWLYRKNQALQCGTWRPYVDAEAARQHIRELKDCGLGDRTIAKLAGLDRGQVRAVLSGRPGRGTPPPPKVRPKTAAAILSVQPTIHNLPPYVMVDATGTQRRLRTLVAEGWPQSHLAAGLGVRANNFALLILHGVQVRVRTAREVRVLYRGLASLDPEEHGVAELQVRRTRQRAVRLRWARAAAWDEDRMDDPEAFPDWTGQCGTDAGYKAHRRAGIPACRPCTDAHNAARYAAA